MENLDLNIENYNLEDILKLFGLSFDFTFKELKHSFKIVAKLHPDKCNLPVKYFHFFKKAYSILLQIEKVRSKQDTMREEFYRKDQEILCNKLTKSEDFNRIFNSLFEETVGTLIEDKNGYNDWLKSDDGIFNDEAKNITELHNKINQHKQRCNQLAKRDDIMEFNASLDSYSGDIFGKLRYNDVKEVHENSVIPISEDAMDRNRPQSIHQMQQARSSQNTNPLSREESHNILNQSKRKENINDMHKMYNLIQEDERNKKINQNWWGKLNSIGYK